MAFSGDLFSDNIKEALQSFDRWEKNGAVDLRQSLMLDCMSEVYNAPHLRHKVVCIGYKSLCSQPFLEFAKQELEAGLFWVYTS